MLYTYYSIYPAINTIDFMVSCKLANENNQDNINFIGSTKWQDIAQPFFNKAEIYRKSHNNLVLTVFEWQHYTPLLFGYDNDTKISIMSEIEQFLKKNIKYLCKIYLSINQIVTLAECDNPITYHNQIKKFFKDCLEFGSSLKPNSLYIRFKAGSAILDDCFRSSLNNAYVALYETKKLDIDHQFLTDSNLEIIKDSHHQTQLAAYFLEAILNHRLRLAFQPVINAKTGKVESYEALLRILTQDGKIISAGPFIPAAENFGYINLIDHFVLKSVINELKIDANVNIAMNISNLTVGDVKWYNKAKSLLKVQLAKRLTIEITETGNELNLLKVAKFVDKIKSLGCNVAIDDFGAGYTSFKQLKLVSADILKIDGVFVKDIMDNHESRLFVNILLDFARAYNLKTVAEFVETGEIAKILIELGVDYLQGFYFNQALNYRPWIKEDVRN